MRIVLLGDSHLARVRRDLSLLGSDVCNGAEGGASSLDLLAQATRADVDMHDLVVISIGTTDAAPWKHVPSTTFSQAAAPLPPVRSCASVGRCRSAGRRRVSPRDFGLVLPASAETVRATA